MAGGDIEHITPEEDTLSSISVNIDCPKGCNRTFANSSALRLHLSLVHQEEPEKSSMTKPGAVVWYHCPLQSCIYHADFGANGRYFTKLKYLKQHYLKVHAARSCVCQCGRGFSTAALLARHRRHCGLQLMCTCGRSFPALETLQTHVRRSGHALHCSTIHAIRARRNTLNESNKAMQQSGHTSSPMLWAHHIPIKYHNVDSTNKGDEIMELLTPASPPLTSTSTPANICPAPPNICPAPALGSSTTHLQQPTHLLAAIALSELGATSIKRLPCVDVGIQTEAEVARRSRRKSSSPARCWEPSLNSSSRHSGKRKRTTETQTRLTHRDSKRQQTNPSPILTGGTPTSSLNTVTSQNTSLHVVNTAFMNSEHSGDCSSEPGSFGSLSLQVDLPEFITTQQSSSGTQTSPRGSRLTQSHLHNFAFSLFDQTCGDDGPRITSSVTITSTQTPDPLDSYPSSQLLIDDADDLLGDVDGPTIPSRQRPPPLCNIRSSSIETQTDHDVLLSKNADMPDDTDEIILTTTETQTDPSSLLAQDDNTSYRDSSSYQSSVSCQVHGNDSLWCTSETQTYEDFSDIEQFMCSTIHTQTPDQSHSELFPELSFTHTQTQTSLDDPPALVTTHTQTHI
ncbi:hypothetical protein Pmani_025318 [Petrolisthes manimaculis]|uniref:C2H2-type domain-containing protein n=1 Tax=Petrolisthes manimaculis TaxID=1843537 RepID=A0AAE1P6Y9_9EUCA|nr:hypothetical protein Pmani_025318 [Petrolisthes manimaculis]